MEANAEIYYEALGARDTRFDGVFFVGVTSTGIYCRPVCPARTPGRSRCRFFEFAATAEKAGFRPCLRCRPELAPGQAPIDSGKQVARRVLARIQAGALDNGGSLEDLAQEIGLSSRQVRRVVGDELGVSPIEIALTHRLLLAKQLLTETRLPVIDVAFASGFASLRRFNDAFVSRYRLSPTQLRKVASSAPRGSGLRDETLRLRLGYRPPLAWSDLLAFLSARAIPGVEQVDGDSYRRTAAIGEHRGWLQVTRDPTHDRLHVELAIALTPVLQDVLGRLRDLFDLSARPDLIESHLSKDPKLARLVRKRPGLRVPGSFDGFELGWRAILGQQVSVRGATTLSGRLAERFGEPITTPFEGLRLISPTAARVGRARTDTIAKVGLPGARARSLQELARFAHRNPSLLRPGAPVQATVAELQGLPGIGPWTTSYVAMRVLRDPDAFLETDLGIRKAVGETSAKKICEKAERWRPWRSYAAMHLWNDLGGG